MKDEIRIHEEDFNIPPSSKEDMVIVDKARKKSVGDCGIAFVAVIASYIMTFRMARSFFTEGFMSENNTVLMIPFVFISVASTIFLVKIVVSTKNNTGFIKRGFVVDRYSHYRSTIRRDYIVDVAFEDNTIYMGQRISRKDYKKLDLNSPVALVTFGKHNTQAVLINRK